MNNYKEEINVRYIYMKNKYIVKNNLPSSRHENTDKKNLKHTKLLKKNVVLDFKTLLFFFFYKRQKAKQNLD